VKYEEFPGFLKCGPDEQAAESNIFYLKLGYLSKMQDIELLQSLV
jgi:hypothetical protein